MQVKSLHLRQTGNWHRLAGAMTLAGARRQLACFWERFRVLQGGHEVFMLEQQGKLQLQDAVPLIWHGEARGLCQTFFPFFSARFFALCISVQS